MSNIQFDFNPITPVPSGGGNFPWKSVLIGLGLLAIIIAVVYNLTKPEEDHNPANMEGDHPDN